MQLVKNVIYFINSTGQISLIDLLSKKIENLNFPDIQKNIVNDFFIYGDVLYYLSGGNCNYYMAKCNLTLRQYNLVSKQDKVLANNITFPKIMGYDAPLNKLYMKSTFGDAGIYAQSIEEYDFVTGKINPVAATSYDGENNMPHNPDEDKKIKDIENRLNGQLDRIDEITIENGKIIKDQKVSGSNFDGIRYVKN
jgi:hypothetical protein